MNPVQPAHQVTPTALTEVAGPSFFCQSMRIAFGSGSSCRSHLVSPLARIRPKIATPIHLRFGIANGGKRALSLTRIATQLSRSGNSNQARRSA